MRAPTRLGNRLHVAVRLWVAVSVVGLSAVSAVGLGALEAGPVQAAGGPLVLDQLCRGYYPCYLNFGQKGVAYAPDLLKPTGGTPPYTVKRFAGRMPKGMFSEFLGAPLIWGTPTVAGRFELTFVVTDSSKPRHQHASQSYALVISP